MDYLLHLVVLMGVYAILAMSLDIVSGHTGLVCLSHGAFYGLGAYTSALLSIRCGGSFVIATGAGMAVAAAASLLISISSARLKGDYFVVGSFAFQVFVSGVFNNWGELTRGPMGLSGIPEPRILGRTIHSRIEFAVVALAVAACTLIAVRRVALGRFGRVLHAIREDEDLVRSLGRDPVRFKVVAFAFSAALAAGAGSLYAHYVSYIDPTSFTVSESILVVSMAIIGGAGSTWGPAVGAGILVALPEALRFIGFPVKDAASLRQVLYGALLVVIVALRPQGLVGQYHFGRVEK